jgi:G3E family GTPase
VHGRLRVTIVTGTSAALAALLCPRMCAFGLPVVRYRHQGNLLLRSHGGERVLVLPETADPLGIALAADAAGATVETVGMIADLNTVATDLGGDETLAERGLAASTAGRRSLAGLLARQAETADVFLTWTPPGTDPSRARLGRTLLAHLSPWACFLDLDATADLAAVDKPRFDPQGVLERTEPGGALPPCPDACAGVATLTRRSRRPFHPERLHAALGRVMDTGVRRARGHLWLASRPLTLLSWQITGRILAIEPPGGGCT